MHRSVFLKELVDGLSLESGDTVVDATINGGGHAEEAGARIGPTGTLVGIDLDRAALEAAKERLQMIPCKKIFEEENFRNLESVLAKHGIKEVDAVMFDLGLSSNQLEHSGRGFSFMRDEPLQMTFSASPERTAADLVQQESEEEIARILFELGEERNSRHIARAIVDARKKERILSSARLAAIIEKAAPRRGRIHPAPKIFQALRIAVNAELRNVREGLQAAHRVLGPKGRIGVITFHSLEDRIVKQFFKTLEGEGEGKILTKKPIMPTRTESQENPKARSAKLRFFENRS